MKTQRDSFWDKIYELAQKDRDIIVISADMGAPALDKFRTNLPSQFINTGIAEQNAILVASGLAKEGKKVFVYAIASFLTLNCIEKIRVQSGMMNIPINIVGVGAGFSYPDSGPTHHLSEDIAIMRAIPNITTISVSDEFVAEKIAIDYKNFNNTYYIRLERQPDGVVFNSSDEVDLDKGIHLLSKGKKTLVLSNGNLLFKCRDIIKENKLDLGLCDLYRYPVNLESFKEVVSNYEKIICVEESFLPGGIGSAVLEALSDLELSIPCKRIGADTKNGYCYSYGGREEIHKFYGFDTKALTKILSEA